MWPFRQRRSVGQQGEKLAAAHLRRHGFKILGRNVHLGRYEIDIIAREGDTVAFVEVKTRRGDAFVPPEENVTRGKRHHIRQAARTFIAEQDDPSLYYRFDVIAVVLRESGEPSLTHYRDAFSDE